MITHVNVPSNGQYTAEYVITSTKCNATTFSTLSFWKSNTNSITKWNNY